MNKLFTVIAVLFSLGAHADVCGKYLACGDFAGEMTDQKGDLIDRETVSISNRPNGAMGLAGELRQLDGSLYWNYDFDLVFAADDSFTIYASGTKEVRGGGYCEAGICTYATRPVKGLALSGILSFDGAQIIRTHLLQDTKGEVSLATSRMPKKN